MHDAPDIRTATPADGAVEGAGDRAARGGVGRDGEVAALVALLDDGEERVSGPVERRLRQLSRRARPALRRASRDDDPRRRLRARRLLADLDRELPRRRLLATLLDDDADLETGLLRLSRWRDPAFDPRPVRAALDALAGQVAERAVAAPTPERAALALPAVLAREAGLRGAVRNYHHPSHAFLDTVLETGRGLPLTLTAIYLAVARRVGLDARPVALPGHVVLRLRAGERELLVDPFARGRARSAADLRAQLRSQGLEPRREWFRPTDDASLLRRQVGNLVVALREHGRPAEAEGLIALLSAVDRQRERRRERRRAAEGA